MNGQTPWEPVVAAGKPSLLARISNWLHGKTGESVLELAKEVDAALREPPPLEALMHRMESDGHEITFEPPLRMPQGQKYRMKVTLKKKPEHQHEHTVLTRGCELCLNAARALTPEERDECMLLLESIETVRCQVGGIYGCPRPARVIGHNAAGGGSALCQQHFDEDQERGPLRIWIEGEPYLQGAKLLSLGRIVGDRSRRAIILREVANRGEALDREPDMQVPGAASSPPQAPSDVASHLETLLRDQLADARQQAEAWQTDNVRLSRINADDAETIRVLRAELQCAQAACAAWQGDYQRLRDESNKRTESTISDDLLITRLREEADVMVDRYQIAQHELAEEQNARQTMTARLHAAGDVLTYISKTLKSAMDAQATELADVIKRAARAAELTRG